MQQKHSPWDGASRSVAAIWSPLLNQQQHVSHQLIHITDWLPTLLSAANITTPLPAIDGINVWDALSNGEPSPRTELVINIDPLPSNSYSAMIKNEFKYVNGTTHDGAYDQWLGIINASESHPLTSFYSSWILRSDAGRAFSAVSSRQLTRNQIATLRKESTISCGQPDAKMLCNPLAKPCLFDLIRDPCERNNLADIEVEKLNELGDLVQQHAGAAVEPRNQPTDDRCDPVKFNDTWTWWWDELGIIDRS